MPDLLTWYHFLPAPLRSVAASARGLQLRCSRYGPETETLVEEALAREQWSPERWRQWQQEQLARLLHRAATRVPYYREQWAARRRRGDRSSWEDLENWPILTKEAVRRQPRDFVADDCNPRRMIEEQTSGTTGTPLRLWQTRATVRRWYALFEARWRRWHGVSRYDRWANLSGQVVVPVARRRPPFWVWNAPMRQLYLSSYHLGPQYLPHYFVALEAYRIRYLWGYASSLVSLARQALERNGRRLRLQLVLTNAERLCAHQRDLIQEAFGCPVRETYGMCERVAAAGECAAGRLHLWPEAGVVEVLSGDKPVAAGQTGELVCTGLINPDMPLVRYRTGDLGAISSNASGCPCGRTLPMLECVEGRIDDCLYLPDGRCHGGSDAAMGTELPIREAQIIQEAFDRVRVKLVPDNTYDQRAAELIKRRIRQRLGPVEVLLECVPEIPRGPNGKFRAVICQIPPDQRPRPAAAS